MGTAYANTNEQLAEQLGKAFNDLKKLIAPISDKHGSDKSGTLRLERLAFAFFASLAAPASKFLLSNPCLSEIGAINFFRSQKAFRSCSVCNLFSRKLMIMGRIGHEYSLEVEGHGLLFRVGL